MIKNPSIKRNTHLRSRPSSRLRYLLLALLGLVILCVGRTPFSPEAMTVEPGPPPVVETGVGEAQEPAEPGNSVAVTDMVVRPGDTLYDILKGEGVPDQEILDIAGSRVDGIRPSRLKAGRSYRLFHEGERLVQYQYEPDDERFLNILFPEGGPILATEPIPYEIIREPIGGVIEDSLFAAVESIGERASLAMDLADIFAWQVDFFRDLRKGDSFSVLVDKYYRDGRFVRYGSIEAARFTNNGSSYKAFLFGPEGGRKDYFDERGDSLRKQFLKAPLRFRRISSGFSTRRLHPVTGKVAPHLGVDYAAPTGTPIMSIGDGKVVMRKRDAANGRIIKIRHNSVYSSAYAHMNSFASGTKVGSKVRQGQVIGYVGSTGRATGPHLHFVMYRNGRYVDPRRISVPRAGTVSREDMPGFQALVDRLDPLLADNVLALTGKDGNGTDVLR